MDVVGADAPRKRRRRSRGKKGSGIQDGDEDTSVGDQAAPEVDAAPSADEPAPASAPAAGTQPRPKPIQSALKPDGSARKRSHIELSNDAFDKSPDEEADVGLSFWDSIALPTDDIALNIAPPSEKPGPRQSSANDRRSAHTDSDVPAKPRTVKFSDEVLDSRKQGTDENFFAQNNPYKPSAVGTHHTLGQAGQTVSLAVPGSVVLNAQSAELRARLVAHIARAAAIFNIDEIVVWHDSSPPPAVPLPRSGRPMRGGRGGFRGGFSDRHGARQDDRDAASGPDEDSAAKHDFDPDNFMARLLTYLETPQYLRKALMPMHPDLRLAGLLPPLDLPAHVRRDDDVRFREGVIVGPSPKGGRNRGVKGSWDVDVGLWDPVHIVPSLNEDGTRGTFEAGKRVTVRMPTAKRGRAGGFASQEATLVDRTTPTQEDGTYWGYVVRSAASLADVFKSSTFVSAPDERGVDAYDLVIGTSERGAPLTQVLAKTFMSKPDVAAAVGVAPGSDVSADGEALALRPFQHALIVFGGVSGLEVAVEHDEGIPLPAGQAHELFDSWINVAEDQGSRTIRTEEAVLIALARLVPALRGLRTSA